MTTKYKQGVVEWAARRRALAITVALLAAGGGLAAYSYSTAQAQRRKRHHGRKREQDGEIEPVAAPPRKGGSGLSSTGGRRGPQKKRRGGAKALVALASILAKEMGEPGMQSLLSLAGLAIFRTALSNRLARVQGYLFKSVFLRKVPLFIRLIAENLLLCFAQSVIISSVKYLNGSLALQWRKILTQKIHSDYFQDMVYYKMSYVDGRLTSPEQRIASDVPRFCVELADLFQENALSLCDALFYTYRLCSYTHPKYALGILGYVLGAGAITGALSPPFGKLIAEEQQQEGDYRQLHTRLRTHSESIAFYGGQDREASIVRHKFRQLTKHVSTLLHTQWWFGIIQDFFLKYCGATWAVVLIIGPFFGGEATRLSSIQQRATTLSNMRYHTSVVISLFQAMGTLATSTRRVSRLSGLADRISELVSIGRELRLTGVAPSLTTGIPAGVFQEADHIEFEGVTVVTPAGTKLVENLNLVVNPGHNLLITGPNGSGKSSLFRVLGGLWPLISGRIAKPGRATDLSHDIFYVPQRPYTAIGTLQDQLVYPLTSADLPEPLTEPQMRSMLQIVDLQNLIDRYPPDEEVNWGEELSLGEQQRLGMARLFYHAPAFAILDECTSAVTTDMEERFCARVRAMGTTCVTISHRPALVAFHDTVLALDGEGGWTVHYKRDGSGSGRAKVELVDRESELEVKDSSKLMITERKSDASVNIEHFMSIDKQVASGDLDSDGSHTGQVLRRAPPGDPLAIVPAVPTLKPNSMSMPWRVAVLTRILMPRLAGKQGVQLSALASLVVARTILSDRIASLNGATVDNMLQQDLSAFARLIAVSVLQSSASAFIAPTIRYLTASVALGWRKRLTNHLSELYFRNNAVYKSVHLAKGMEDPDARISQDVDKLCRDMSSLVTNLVKPFVDIFWFTWRMQSLTGRRGVGILYAYMLLGLGFLRTITPDFSSLTQEELRLEGAFRYMHSRLRTHAESVAFFGGGTREHQVVQSRFAAVLSHGRKLLRKRWLFGIADEFITKQLPHNVTWVLSLLYALDYPLRDNLKDEGRLAHDVRFLASVVSQSFLAFGDILEMYRKFLELSGGISRVSELDELLKACQPEPLIGAGADARQLLAMEEEEKWASSRSMELTGEEIAFQDVDVVTPSAKLLARKLTVSVLPGHSLLVTGPNGSGKSSLFRVLGGLWPLVSGRLAKPGSPPLTPTGPAHLPVELETGLSREIFYVPQRPYTALGTLRDQIIYPLSLQDASTKVQQEGWGGQGVSAVTALDACLQTILEDVRLVYLLEREGGWDARATWEDMLSLGEQQRLGMARLFFHRPKFGILDECTNATSVDVEEGLYKKAQGLGITVVTISQRPALIPYHTQELRLIDGEGDWELRSISKPT